LATFSEMMVAPIGIPPPSGLAKVKISGVTS